MKYALRAFGDGRGFTTPLMKKHYEFPS